MISAYKREGFILVGIEGQYSCTGASICFVKERRLHQTTRGQIMKEKALEIMRQDVRENRTAYTAMAEAESVGDDE